MEENNEARRHDSVNDTEEKQVFSREEVMSIIDRANLTINQLNDTRSYQMSLDRMNFLFKIVENEIHFEDKIVELAKKDIINSIFSMEENEQKSNEQ